MPIHIDDFVLEVPASETASGQQARDAHGAEGATPTPAWTAEFAHTLDLQLGLAVERRARLLAD